MEKLEFLNPVVNPGLNVTVRRGVKWDLKKGSDVHLCETGQPTPFGEATINNTKVMRFCDLKDKDLVNEHDESCRNKTGLLAAMRQAYPDFDEEEVVSAVFFNVK